MLEDSVPVKPKVDLVGAYLVLSKALNLSHVIDNIYSDGKHKYMLTKYGFQPANTFNKQVIIDSKRREMNILEDKYYYALKENRELKCKINSMDSKIESLNHKIKSYKGVKKKSKKKVDQIKSYSVFTMKEVFDNINS